MFSNLLFIAEPLYPYARIKCDTALSNIIISQHVGEDMKKLGPPLFFAKPSTSLANTRSFILIPLMGLVWLIPGLLILGCTNSVVTFTSPQSTARPESARGAASSAATNKRATAASAKIEIDQKMTR
jgi:hypothetical protein